MAEDSNIDPEVLAHPLAGKVVRAIKAHPVLRDQKKLEVKLDGRRVRMEGTVFTRDMFRQLAELVSRIPGSDEIAFEVEPEIRAPEDRSLEGRVPRSSQGRLVPSAPRYSIRHLPRRG